MPVAVGAAAEIYERARMTAKVIEDQDGTRRSRVEEKAFASAPIDRNVRHGAYLRRMPLHTALRARHKGGAVCSAPCGLLAH